MRYNFDELSFENENARLLCGLLHMLNPQIKFPDGYITESFAVAYYNTVTEHRNLASDNLIYGTFGDFCWKFVHT